MTFLFLNNVEIKKIQNTFEFREKIVFEIRKKNVDAYLIIKQNFN